MIRAANTGVSAVIDAYGRVLASLDMQQEGIIDHRLPPAREATPYSRWGDWTLLALIGFLAVSVVGWRPIKRAANPIECFDRRNARGFGLHYPERGDNVHMQP